MGIINRRNAMLGWAAWRIGKRVMKKKARSAVPGGGEEASRKRKLGAVLPVLAAVGGALWFWRKSRTDDDFPPGETDY
jgi:hypothetical protein